MKTARYGLCFNSCPHAEGNISRATYYSRLRVSIRALTRRATELPEPIVLIFKFQFVPSRGGQLSIAVFARHHLSFQFVPSRGGQQLHLEEIANGN